MSLTVNNINIKGLNEQLELLKISINNIQNVINKVNNELINNKTKKILYNNFIINKNNMNNLNLHNVIDEFYKKSINKYYNSNSNNLKKPIDPNYVNNNKLYEQIPLEELMKQLDSSLSCTHIIEILKNFPEKNKEYDTHNYNFIFYKNIVKLFILIIIRLLEKNDKAGEFDKFKTFEELVEVMIKYKIFLTDKLFRDDFLNLKKVLICKTIEFSTINGSIVAWLMFAFLNPDMINENCYLYLNYNSKDFNKNNLENSLKNPNIKILYEKYSSYIDKNMHILDSEINTDSLECENYTKECNKCGHICNKYCDEDCVEYFYEGEYYNYCKFCNEDNEDNEDNEENNNDDYKFCKYCNGECSCE
jgi:hypothetical protein